MGSNFSPQFLRKAIFLIKRKELMEGTRIDKSPGTFPATERQDAQHQDVPK